MADSMGHDFLDLDKIDTKDLKKILKNGHALKRLRQKDRGAFRPLTHQTLALIFEKPSTRTRVSFEVGMHDLGGHVITLSGAEMQLGRGELVTDTGKVLSRFTDIIMLRTFDEKKLYDLAEGATVPVINGLTNQSHPCQVMADIMTVEERQGTLDGKTVVWLGDGDNNVLTSWIHAACHFSFNLRVVAPPEFVPAKDLLIAAHKKGAKVSVTADIKAVEGADVVITDCWVSMHQSDAAARQMRLEPYRVDTALMKKAAPNAIFMHCLPAHRGEEVSDDVIDSVQSVVFDEAENRMHAQKAIICHCLNIDGPV